MRSEHFISNGIEETNPLEILYDHFSEADNGLSKEILSLSKNLREKLVGMNQNCANAIFEDVALLCVEYERKGFFGGIQMGARLMSDIK